MSIVGWLLPENCIDSEAPFRPNFWASRSGSPQLTTNDRGAFHLHCRNTFTILTPLSVFLVELKEYQTMMIYVKLTCVNLLATVTKK
jgi:hypothetical protein